jgi:Viral BACON domain
VKKKFFPVVTAEVVRRKTWPRFLFIFFVGGMVSYFSALANAFPGGESGYSGRNGSTCTMCHSTGAAPAITWMGPTSINSGATANFTLTVGGGGNGGLDVASTAGTFTAGAGTQVLNGEITQTSATTTHSWTFSWTAPTVTTNTVATIYGAAIDGFSGGTGTTTQTITVTPPAPPPSSLGISPTSLAFSYTQGGTAPAAKTLSVSSNGTALSYMVAASGGTWLMATGSATTPGNVSVSVNPAGLNAGTYNGSVTVTSATASNSPQTVPVTLTVAAAPPPPSPTLMISPTSLAFSYTQGGTAPAAKTLSVSSSGTALSYMVAASGGTWLMAIGSGTTSGSVSVSVNPAGLNAGAYNGSVTVTSATASNSPQTVPVTLTVTAAPPPTSPTLTISPSSLAFSYTQGGTAPAAKTLSVGSSGTALSYTVAASGGAWLAAKGGGTTPGSISVAVNPAGLNAGTYNGSVMVSSTTASNSPQTIPVMLTVTSTPPPPPTGGTLTVSTSRLVFYADGSQTPSAKTISVGSAGSPITFTVAAYGSSWVSVTPSGGTTPGTVSVSAYATGLPAGTYSCVVQIKGGSSTKNVEIVLVVGTSQSGGGGDDERTGAQVRPFTFDPGALGTSSASWQNGAGALRSSYDPSNQGLVLTKRLSAPSTAIAGAIVKGAAGSRISTLGFDVRTDSECSRQAPQFVVITADNVVHTAGCTNGSSQMLSVPGWKRVTFNTGNRTQVTPAIQPGMTVKTVALVMDHVVGNGFAVLDNINVNGLYIGKQ